MILPFDEAAGAVAVFFVIPNTLVSMKVGIADEVLRSGGTGDEGFTLCVCEGFDACGEWLRACGKSSGDRGEGVSARDEVLCAHGVGLIGSTGCMLVVVD